MTALTAFNVSASSYHIGITFITPPNFSKFFLALLLSYDLANTLIAPTPLK
jgi:hypothetical protein